MTTNRSLMLCLECLRRGPPASSAISCQAEFASSVVQVPGPENVVADTLSRPSPALPPAPSPSALTLVSPPSSSFSPPLASDPVFSEFDVSLLPPMQLTCPAVADIRSSPTLSLVSVPVGDKFLFCDSSTGSLLPLVLVQLCCQLFHLLNLLCAASHPGVWASWRLISSRFLWPGLSGDVGLWAHSCLRCQGSKIQTQVHSSVPAIPVPTQRFSHVYINIMGPLPSSQGYSYLLTMMDRTTHWPEVALLNSISTESCVRAFLATWV